MSNMGLSGFDENTELGVGSVYGFRYWSLNVTGNITEPPFGPLIYGSYGQYWEPGENRAVCRGMEFVPEFPHSAPHRDCGCGFWAYWNPEPLGLRIAGVVQGYGRTLIGEKGFRSERAVIKALTVYHYMKTFIASTPEVHQIENYLRSYYNVPVYDSTEEMLKDFPLTSDYLPQKSLPLLCTCPLCVGEGREGEKER